MSLFRMEPAPCPVCGAAHTACTADPGPITVAQLPARDALARVTPRLTQNGRVLRRAYCYTGRRDPGRLGDRPFARRVSWQGNVGRWASSSTRRAMPCRSW